MSLAHALAHSADKPAGKRPYFLDPQVERVLNIVLALVQELSVTRARLDTLERLLADKGLLDRAEFDRFQPDAEAAAERGLWTQAYLNRVFRILNQEGQAIEANRRGDLYSEEVAVEVSAAEGA